ncbi:hypothetical protein ES702_05518 [subsurface metagenome]
MGSVHIIDRHLVGGLEQATWAQVLARNAWGYQFHKTIFDSSLLLDELLPLLLRNKGEGENEYYYGV